MSILLALAVAATAPAQGCPSNLFPRDSAPLIERATAHLCALNQWPEAVRFRNLVTNGDAVCGEISQPAGHAMSPYRRFAFYATRRWAIARVGEYGGELNGRYEDSELFATDRRILLRHGDRVGAQAIQQRRSDFEASAQALVATCH